MSFTDEINAEIALNEHIQAMEIKAHATKHTWCTKDGRKILIKDMDASHLENTIALIRRNPDMEDRYCDYIPLMQAELNTRKKETKCITK